MEIRCRIIYDGARREECVLAAVPREGERFRLGVEGQEFSVIQVTHIANRRDGLDPHAFIFAAKVTKVEHAPRS
jgi:hypothetical protein